MPRKSADMDYATLIASIDRRIEKHQQNIDTLSQQRQELEEKQQVFELNQLRAFLAGNNLSISEAISTLQAVAASSKKKDVEI